MTEWRVLEADRRTTHCPIALELRDEFTGGAVIGDVQLALDIKQGAAWAPSDRKPTRTPGGVYVFTGLGHAADPVALPSFRVRVRISATYYGPRYRVTADGLEFDVPTYNDVVPPAALPPMPEIVLLLPTSSYPFGAHIRVLRGRVIDPLGDPVADALVEADGVERVISDSKGGFSLPLRWQGPTALVAVTVDHPRSGLGAALNFSLPNDLTGNNDIPIA
jgi:hypothetical protein